jgi:hypothetical protein
MALLEGCLADAGQLGMTRVAAWARDRQAPAASTTDSPRPDQYFVGPYHPFGVMMACRPHGTMRATTPEGIAGLRPKETRHGRYLDAGDGRPSPAEPHHRLAVVGDRDRGPARFVRVLADAPGLCPPGHGRGPGHPHGPCRRGRGRAGHRRPGQPGASPPGPAGRQGGPWRVRRGPGDAARPRRRLALACRAPQRRGAALGGFCGRRPVRRRNVPPAPVPGPAVGQAGPHRRRRDGRSAALGDAAHGRPEVGDQAVAGGAASDRAGRARHGRRRVRRRGGADPRVCLQPERADRLSRAWTGQERRRPDRQRGPVGRRGHLAVQRRGRLHRTSQRTGRARLHRPGRPQPWSRAARTASPSSRTSDSRDAGTSPMW